MKAAVFCTFLSIGVIALIYIESSKNELINYRYNREVVDDKLFSNWKLEQPMNMNIIITRIGCDIQQIPCRNAGFLWP
jgi:hypothetical protein